MDQRPVARLLIPKSFSFNFCLNKLVNKNCIQRKLVCTDSSKFSAWHFLLGLAAHNLHRLGILGLQLQVYQAHL